jgi:hypothetical protein
LASSFLTHLFRFQKPLYPKDIKLLNIEINILCFAFLVLDYSIIQPLAKEAINASLATFDLN